MNFENYPVTGHVYEHVYDLLTNQPNIQTEKAVIFLINWPYGFGSALIIHIQNAIFLTNLNKNLIVLPHYSNNTRNFKYHEINENNSFFTYFKKNDSKTVDMSVKIYFAKAMVLSDMPKITYKIPVMSDSTNKEYIQYLLDNYTPILNENVRTYIDSIRQNNKPLIGILIRSIAQKRLENNSYLTVDLDTRLQNVKQKIENLYPHAIIFIATDVSLYIHKMKSLFDNVTYLDYIKRVYNEGDTIPQLDKYKGHILGRDIMDDCYALSMCDKVYVSNSNIPFLVTMMNNNIQMEEY